MWRLKRWGGTAVTAILGFLALGDAPSQVSNWKAGWDRFVASIQWDSGPTRWAMLAMAIIVGLWSWDVPQRALQKIKPEWLARWRAWGERAKSTCGDCGIT